MDAAMSGLDAVQFLGGTQADYVVERTASGVLGSRHVVSKRFLPSVRAQNLSQLATNGMGSMLQTGLGVANLGVGLLNLGVGLWTAAAVGRIEDKVEDLSATAGRSEAKLDRLGGVLEQSFQRVEGMIHESAVMLGLLLDGQEALRDGQQHMHRNVIALRDEVRIGNRSLHEALVSERARREADALEQKMRELQAFQVLCARALQAARRPAYDDLRRQIDLAVRLATEADMRLQRVPVGDVERFPYLTTRAFALVCEVGARRMLGQTADARNDELRRTQELVADELRALTRGATPYAMAVENRDLIRNYVYLRRALGDDITVAELGDGTCVPCLPQNKLQWDDGLDALREQLNRAGSGPTPAMLELHTLDEHRALSAVLKTPLRGDEERTSTAPLLQALGVPMESVFDEATVRRLLAVAPGAVANVQSSVQHEVGR